MKASDLRNMYTNAFITINPHEIKLKFEKLSDKMATTLNFTV